VKDLCLEQEIVEFLSGLTSEGGGTVGLEANMLKAGSPEAVLRVLMECATKISWRDANAKMRFLFHIADPSHHWHETEMN
jgi:hypothetical protein